VANERVFKLDAQGELERIPGDVRDPLRRYRLKLHPVDLDNIYVEFTDAEEAARTLEENAPPFDPANWYWIIPAQTGVYHSARFAYVPLADSAYVAFLAAGGAAYTGLASDAELRAYLNNNNIAYLAEALPPVEVLRASIPRARVRLQRASFSLPNNAITAIDYTGAGIDPLDFHNHGSANPDRIVVPAGHAGTYVITAGFRFLESSAAGGGVANAGDRVGGVRRGASEDLVRARVRASAADNTEFQVYDEVVLAVGDVLRVGALQNCGGTMNVATRFTLRRLE
jgi:hypothetical protein